MISGDVGEPLSDRQYLIIAADLYFLDFGSREVKRDREDLVEGSFPSTGEELPWSACSQFIEEFPESGVLNLE